MGVQPVLGRDDLRAAPSSTCQRRLAGRQAGAVARPGRCACRPPWSAGRTPCSAPRWRSCARRPAAPPAPRGPAAPRRHARAISCCDSAITFFALLRKSPIVRMMLAHLAPRRAPASFAACRRAANSARRRLVDAGIGRLRRKHHGDQQREGVDVLELALRLRLDLGEAPEDLGDRRCIEPLRLRLGNALGGGLRLDRGFRLPRLDFAMLTS